MVEHYNYTPQLRPAPANVLARGGWIRGTFRVPPHQSLLDFVAAGVQVVKFTRVTVAGDPQEFAFVGLRRDAISIIEPTLGDELVESPGTGHITTPRNVTCLLDVGTLTGTLEVLVHVRVSDYMRQAPEFMVMRDCLWVPAGETPSSPQARRMRTVLVNLSLVIGIGEREGQGNA